MRRNHGFTLTELLVASSLLSIVMAAVYVSFGNTIQVWRAGETETNHYQDARMALNMLSRELECILGGAGHLVEGKDDELEFFAVTPPLDVKKGEGTRVMWVRYYATGRKLYRQEAPVEGPLPLIINEGEDEEKVRERIKLGRKKKFELADNVNDFDISYLWIPPDPNRNPQQPPVWVTPITLKRNEKGWGLPQGVRVVLSLRNADDKKKASEFVLAKTFRGPTSQYDEKRIGKSKEEPNEDR